MAYAQKTGLKQVARICCHIIRILNRYAGQNSSIQTSDPGLWTCIQQLLTAATCFCNYYTPEQV